MSSRNQREGHFVGRAWGKAVRRYVPLVPRPRSQFARAYRRGQQARQEARRTGVPIQITHLGEQGAR